jgi:hypothetical protein
MLTCHYFCRSKVVHHESFLWLLLPFHFVCRIVKARRFPYLARLLFRQLLHKGYRVLYPLLLPARLYHPDTLCSCKTYHPVAALSLYGQLAQLADGFVSLHHLWTARRVLSNMQFKPWFIGLRISTLSHSIVCTTLWPLVLLLYPVYWFAWQLLSPQCIV